MGCISDLNLNWGYIALRTAIEPEQMANGLRATVRSLEPQLPLDQVQSLERTVSDSEAPRRFNTALIAAFAFAAILLAALGIYGVIAFSAALRTQEMAIRIGLGSRRSGILGWFLRPQPNLRSQVVRLDCWAPRQPPACCAHSCLASVRSTRSFFCWPRSSY
jgi:hypothetical protein